MPFSLTSQIVLFCALVVFGHHSLLQEHCKGRKEAAPALLVCRARTGLLLLVLNKWNQSNKREGRKQTNKQAIQGEETMKFFFKTERSA